MQDRGDYPGKKRKHINILLEPHRGELLASYVEKVQKKRSDVLRDIIYSFLETEVGSEAYSEAEKKDQLEWDQVVRNRSDGRALAKLIRSTQSKSKGFIDTDEEFP
tara:strand:- start:130 stop:447 length:318 start_codon:yes stop_codon:yes gene_type:complete